MAFDNRNDEILLMRESDTDAALTCFRLSLQDCLENAVEIDKINDSRVELYQFPNLDPLPEVNDQNSERYYRDEFLPLPKKLGIEPKAVIHTHEMVYAMLNGIPIEVGRPGNNIRQRSDYAEQCKSLPGKSLELPGKKLAIKMPEGEIQINVDGGAIVVAVIQQPRHVPAVSSESSPKHGVS